MYRIAWTNAADKHLRTGAMAGERVWPRVWLLVALVGATAVVAVPMARAPPSTVGGGPSEPRFTSYEYDFGAEHGFGASARVPKPVVTPEIVENLKEEADAGSRGAWCHQQARTHTHTSASPGA